MPIRPNAGIPALTLLWLFSKRISFARWTHEFYPNSTCRIRVRPNQLPNAPKVERINSIWLSEMSSNTDSYIGHPLSKSKRSPYRQTWHMIMSTVEITALTTTYRSMITASTNIDCFIIDFCTLMAAEKSSETDCLTRQVTRNDDNYHDYRPQLYNPANERNCIRSRY